MTKTVTGAKMELKTLRQFRGWDTLEALEEEIRLTQMELATCATEYCKYQKNNWLQILFSHYRVMKDAPEVK